MNDVRASLMALAGLAAAANAQSAMNLQVSTDGITWTDDAVLALLAPQTATVLIRATMTWTGQRSPTFGPFGLFSLTWQPVFGNIRPGVDSIEPFANQGNNLNGGAVVLDGTPLDGPFGRVQPFGATGPFGTQRYAAITHSGGSGGAPPGNFLRISRNDVTRWIGTGPTTTAAAVNNFNGAGGLACVQKGDPVAGDPPRNFGIDNVVIFQVALTVGGVGGGSGDPVHIIDVLAPTNGMSRNPATGVREASWFGQGDILSGSIKGAVSVDGATITILPAPGVLSLLSLAGLAMRRRRPENRREVTPRPHR